MDINAIYHAIILGAVQGFTEFLPISSSAHLVLAQEVLGISPAGKAFDLVLHGGSLLALAYYLRAELTAVGRGLSKFVCSGLRQWPEAESERLGAIVFVTMIPTSAVGFLLDPLVETYLQGRWLLALMLGGFALVMATVDKWAKKREAQCERYMLAPNEAPNYDSDDGLTCDSDAVSNCAGNELFRRVRSFASSRINTTNTWTWKESLMIGTAQSLAFIPGVSRSGITMTMARALGLSRAQAVRVAMMMALPVIAGAISVKVVSGALSQLALPIEAWGSGVAMAAVCSWLSLRLLDKIGDMLQISAVYRIIVALILAVTLFV